MRDIEDVSVGRSNPAHGILGHIGDPILTSCLHIRKWVALLIKIHKETTLPNGKRESTSQQKQTTSRVVKNVKSILRVIGERKK